MVSSIFLMLPASDKNFAFAERDRLYLYEKYATVSSGVFVVPCEYEDCRDKYFIFISLIDLTKSSHFFLGSRHFAAGLVETEAVGITIDFGISFSDGVFYSSFLVKSETCFCKEPIIESLLSVFFFSTSVLVVVVTFAVVVACDSAVGSFVERFCEVLPTSYAK